MTRPIRVAVTLATLLLGHEVVSASQVTTNAQLDSPAAKRCFQEARNISERDAGRLWGIPLYGPMLLVDHDTRRVIANEPDPEGHLRSEHGVHVGVLPDEVGVANTAVEWAGKRWTMLMWPLPDDAFDRRALLAHELWHRIQNELDLGMSSSPATHLGTRDGRVWLQLEWRALAAALRSEGSARNAAIVHALAFRAYRRSLFSDAAESEGGLEMNEGLAEYTGFALCGRPTAENIEAVAKHLEDAEHGATFVRSFAYASGPGYGLLLDGFAPSWRQEVSQHDDLGELLGRHVEFSLPLHLSEFAAKAAAKYDGVALMAREDRREQDRQALLADYRRRFVEGPLLKLEFVCMRVEFDPGNVDALDDLGSVYPSMRLTDEWGILTVTGGALITKDWKQAVVPAPRNPHARPTVGEGYELELSSDWTLVPLEGQRGFRAALETSQ